MEIILHLYTVIDAALMCFYRLPDNPLLVYFLGTFVLSVVCIAVGKISISLAFRLNGKQIEYDNHAIEHYQNLSIEALKTGDKTSYKACNIIANNAFGKSFFSKIGLAASSLWPVFTALGWMQYRFSEVEFYLPLSLNGSGITFGYLITFILCYISARILFGKINYKFQYFRKNTTGM